MESSGHLLHGRTTDNSGGVPEKFALSFCGRLSEEPRHVHRLANGVCWSLRRNTPGGTALRRVLHRRDIARYALASQLDGRSFSDIENSAGHIWESLLGRLDFPDPQESRRRTFYSCLYVHSCFLACSRRAIPRAAPFTTSRTTAQSIPPALYRQWLLGHVPHGFIRCSRTPIPTSSRSSWKAGSTLQAGRLDAEMAQPGTEGLHDRHAL